MATRAYLLVESEAGKTNEVVDGLRRLPGITMVDAVTGPYDIVAQVTAADSDAIGKLVLNQVHGLPGVRHTLTCLVMGSGV
ncbi:MAG: Lrp/AsnC ligand binding domain-containing protein [Candidatus Marsarchaeota archaeon]|nr:Lrp/AsnC ligand binding domain-containing protein [Candidatus Marsarchaeota archaeon]